MNETTKRTILVICIALSVLPSVALLRVPSVLTASTILLYGSAVVGYVGVVFLLWMFILGAKSVFGRVFHDLAPVLRIHKWLGKWGSLFIVLHPMLILLSYGKSWLYPLLPNVSTMFERGVTLGRISFVLIVSIAVLSVYFRKKLGFRPWKYIHYLAYIALPFAFLHIPNTGSQFMSVLAIRAYFFVLVLTFVVCAVIRLHALFTLNTARYTVTRHARLTPTDYLLELESASLLGLHPQRGQYVYVRTGFLSEDHPFSVLHYDETSGRITLAYRVFGAFTEHLSSLPVGASVALSGPYGEFTHGSITQHGKPTVFLAGGIGITPFVDHILRAGSSQDFWLFYGNRTKETAVFSDELRSELGQRFVGVYSKQENVEVGDEKGHISAELIKRKLKNPADYRYFVCGPPPMMDACEAILTRLGVPVDQMHFERFSF